MIRENQPSDASLTVPPDSAGNPARRAASRSGAFPRLMLQVLVMGASAPFALESIRGAISGEAFGIKDLSPGARLAALTLGLFLVLPWLLFLFATAANLQFWEPRERRIFTMLLLLGGGAGAVFLLS